VSSLGALSLIAACSSPRTAVDAPHASPYTPFEADASAGPEWLQRGCRTYWADASGQGVCGVGSASGSGNISLMTASAESRGRTAIARSLAASVEAMLAGYQAATTRAQERGERASDEVHIVEVSRQLTDTALNGAERKGLWVSPSGVVYALMVLDLKRFQELVWNMEGQGRSLRSHLARKAPAALATRPVPSRTAPVGASAAAEGPLVLVTQAELDALPRDRPDTQVAWGVRKQDPNGPVIQIDSPEDQGLYQAAFPIRVEFKPGPEGHRVDMESLQLEYKMAWGIDITNRVREYVHGNVIDVAESELPKGKHTIEIQIDDSAGHRSSRLFTVTVE
jgi:hypothetical protein